MDRSIQCHSCVDQTTGRYTKTHIIIIKHIIIILHTLYFSLRVRWNRISLVARIRRRYIMQPISKLLHYEMHGLAVSEVSNANSCPGCPHHLPLRCRHPLPAFYAPCSTPGRRCKPSSGLPVIVLRVAIVAELVRNVVCVGESCDRH